MKKILIELILTNDCNKRCNYCDLDFKNKSFSVSNLDLFVKFLEINRSDYYINFFGGEPLLKFDKIEYFFYNSRKFVSKYSVGTNGILLNQERLEFFSKNNIKIYFSIDNISLGKGLDLNLISKYKDNIIINFVNAPDYLFNSKKCFDKIISFGFYNIAFMPVFSTKYWSKKTLIYFKKLYNYILKNKFINLKTYSYFNGISVDKQFILDTNLYFYSDLDSLLWLQKQYKNIPLELKREIENKTKLLSLKDKELSIDKLLNLHNNNDIVKLAYEISKIKNNFVSYEIINRIFKSN